MNKRWNQAAFIGLGVIMGGIACGQEWETKIVAGLNLKDGNSDTLNLHAGIDGERGGDDDDDNHSRLNAEYNYGETDAEQSVNNFQAAAEHRKVIQRQTYGYGTANLLTDSIANIDYRAIAGAGIGQYLVKNDRTRLGAELGVAWVFEDVVESTDYAALRIGQNLRHEFSEHARLFESFEYLPKFTDFESYLIHFEMGIEADVNSHLALRVVLQDRYDSTPAPGNKNNDLSLIAGLSYSL